MRFFKLLKRNKTTFLFSFVGLVSVLTYSNAINEGRGEIWYSYSPANGKPANYTKNVPCSADLKGNSLQITIGPDSRGNTFKGNVYLPDYTFLGEGHYRYSKMTNTTGDTWTNPKSYADVNQYNGGRIFSASISGYHAGQSKKFKSIVCDRTYSKQNQKRSNTRKQKNKATTKSEKTKSRSFLFLKKNR